jgi:NAD(P)-dependent dehydrogenase (short-subunit alcohol dehydrogenase family)
MSSPAVLSLSGRIAVVLGGTSGIGRALALGLADAGADVVAASRRRSEVEATADEIAARGRKTLRQVADVTSRSSLEALRDATLAAFGTVDILVNAAGKTKRAPTLDFPESDWESIVDTNLTGTLRACQLFGRPMLDAGYGRIINIASVSPYAAFVEVAAYTSSKSGVIGLTKSLAVEWGARGVCVNAVAPGVFRTPLNQALLDGTDRGRELLTRTPMRRFGQVDELVGPTVFLASEAASFVNGHVLVVDGGFLASGVNQ